MENRVLVWIFVCIMFINLLLSSQVSAGIGYAPLEISARYISTDMVEVNITLKHIEGVETPEVSYTIVVRDYYTGKIIESTSTQRLPLITDDSVSYTARYVFPALSNATIIIVDTGFYRIVEVAYEIETLGDNVYSNITGNETLNDVLGMETTMLPIITASIFVLLFLGFVMYNDPRILGFGMILYGVLIRFILPVLAPLMFSGTMMRNAHLSGSISIVIGALYILYYLLTNR